MKTIELTDQQIKEIADELDNGMKVFLNKETKEIKKIFDAEDNIYEDDTEREEQLREIESDFDKYLVFEKMSSGESYNVMKEFIDTVKDKELRKNLDLGLSLSNPFRNFMDIIDGAGNYKQLWFEFKNLKSIEYVKDKLDQYSKELL